MLAWTATVTRNEDQLPRGRSISLVSRLNLGAGVAFADRLALLDRRLSLRLQPLDWVPPGSDRVSVI